MKLVLALVATLAALSFAKDDFPKPPGDICVPKTPLQQSTLGELVGNVLAVLPFNDMVKKVKETMVRDQEVRNFFNYLQGNEVKELVKEIVAIPHFTEHLREFCEDTYLDVYFYLNLLLKQYSLEQVHPPKSLHPRMRSSIGVTGLFEDLMSMVDQVEFGNAMAGFFKNEYVDIFREKVGSQDFKAILYEASSLKEMQNLLEHLKSVGIDIDSFIQMLKTYFQIE